MRFVLDEGLPFRLAAFLEATGHDVAVCGRDHPHALADRDILAIAFRENRILLTNDKGFSDLVFRDRLPQMGVILFRLGFAPAEVRISQLQRALTVHAGSLDRFIVITARSSRVASAPGLAN